MTPESFDLTEVTTTEEYESSPDLTYRLDFANKRIMGKVDGKDAVMQFIKKVLNTDKYAYSVYDWYYGNELLLLVGMPYDYIITECRRIVDEALTVDGRILEVTDFKFERTALDSMTMSFLVKTIYGNIDYSQEVMI